MTQAWDGYDHMIRSLALYGPTGEVSSDNSLYQVIIMNINGMRQSVPAVCSAQVCRLRVPSTEPENAE